MIKNKIELKLRLKRIIKIRKIRQIKSKLRNAEKYYSINIKKN